MNASLKSERFQLISEFGRRPAWAGVGYVVVSTMVLPGVRLRLRNGFRGPGVHPLLSRRVRIQERVGGDARWLELLGRQRRRPPQDCVMCCTDA